MEIYISAQIVLCASSGSLQNAFQCEQDETKIIQDNRINMLRVIEYKRLFFTS